MDDQRPRGRGAVSSRCGVSAAQDSAVSLPASNS
jgi:hypothetical protein